MMILENIREELFRQQDLTYRDFQHRILKIIDYDKIIGVRTPLLRAYAKQLSVHEEIDTFLHSLPHNYYDENQLHAFAVSGIKDFDRAAKEVDSFLPYVDNWSTCDQMSPKVFKKHKKELLVWIRKWLASEHTYTVRFGIGMLMEHFLDEDFSAEYLKTVSKIRTEEYYINMMTAWYFATALAKQYEAALPFIEEQCLDDWTHNKTIQKAIESYRITPEQKAYLRSLKVARK